MKTHSIVKSLNYINWVNSSSYFSLQQPTHYPCNKNNNIGLYICLDLLVNKYLEINFYSLLTVHNSIPYNNNKNTGLYICLDLLTKYLEIA